MNYTKTAVVLACLAWPGLAGADDASDVVMNKIGDYALVFDLPSKDWQLAHQEGNEAKGGVMQFVPKDQQLKTWKDMFAFQFNRPKEASVDSVTRYFRASVERSCPGSTVTAQEMPPQGGFKVLDMVLRCPKTKGEAKSETGFFRYFISDGLVMSLRRAASGDVKGVPAGWKEHFNKVTVCNIKNMEPKDCVERFRHGA